MKRRITSRTIDPAELPTWEPSMPVEWTEPVERIDAMERAVEIAEQAVRRSKWRRRAVVALNGAISITARITRIEELNHLKIKTENDMKRIKPYLKQKSTWEGIAAILGAVGIVIYPDALMEIVAGVFVVIGGIEMWKKEPEDN